jgi:hypothetical protein
MQQGQAAGTCGLQALVVKMDDLKATNYILETRVLRIVRARKEGRASSDVKNS